MTEKWVRDTGLVCALLCLILGVRGSVRFLWLSGACLVIVMFYPSAFKPIAFLWKKVAELLGSVMDKVFFGIIFFVVVTPIGYVRRLFVGDQRYESRENRNSTAFVDRGQMIGAMDMEHPY